MSTPATRLSIFPGQRFGRFLICERIGSGGMGEVFRARDEHLDRDVALKVLSAGVLPGGEERLQLRNEAMALSHLNHPNIATIYDFDEQQGIEYIVTEFVAGKHLSELLLHGPLREHELLEFAIQLVDALASAHDQGLLHRDLKPSNVRLTSGNHIKVLDFGLAVKMKEVDQQTTTTNGWYGLAGTLPYMSPEQLQGEKLDGRSDLYSAGVMFYEMATGSLPFQESSVPSLINAILHRMPPSPRFLNSQISERLQDIINRCLEKNVDYRYQSARDLLADLRRALVSGTGLEKSIAVLYFEDLNRDASGDYFRDGITEDVTTELSKIKELRVLSRSAVLAFKDKPITPNYVGQQLNATHVVEGSVRREASRLRITANLVETTTGHTLWAEKYDRKMEDIFAIQDELAQNIAAALRVALSDRERQAIEKVPTSDINAYDAYLRGRQYFHQFRRKGYDLARDMFARAIEIDPSFARAYSGIADCSSFLYMYWESSEENLSQADEASKRALQLDPDLAEAHSSRGLTASLRKDHTEAHREFDIALRLNPKLYEPYYFKARSFYSQGRLEDAVQWFEHATRVLPEDYQAAMLLASALHGLGRKPEAVQAYISGLHKAEKHLEIYPTDARALYFGANALSQLNEKERALKWVGRALELEPDEHQVLYNVACVYALLEEPELAIDCLERSTTGGWGQKEWMAHDPDLATLRDNPRFKALTNSQ